MRSGPPAVLAPFDRAMNLTEYFVHHEDVRRGGGDTTPRIGAEGQQIEEALWHMLQRGAKFMTRPVKETGLDLVRPDGAVIHVRDGAPSATITGAAGEIVLLLSGRGRAAHVEVGGSSRRRAGRARRLARLVGRSLRRPPVPGTTPGAGFSWPRLRRRGGPDRGEHRPRTRR